MFRFGSKKANRQEYRCSIRFLDDDEAPIDCDFQHMCLGQYILDFVCAGIGLLEKDLFGLRYVDSHNQRRWLDLSKPVLKQVKGLRNVVFCFRVKYYPPNPLDLKEEASRYQVYLQLKRDLSHGRLNCTQSEAALMVACAKQAELGDWDTLAVGGTPSEDGLDDNLNGLPEEGTGSRQNTFTASKLLPKHSQEIESRIERIHQTLKGVSATEAQDLFLKRAASLESYGIDPHPVKDEHNNQLYLGVNHLGVLTFRAGKKDLHIKFDDLVKFNYEGKMFILHVMASGSNKKQVIGFRCPSQAACQHLFSCANDIRCYFTSIPPLISKRNTLSRAMSILKKREISLASLNQSSQAQVVQAQAPQLSPGRSDHELAAGLDGSANDLNLNRPFHSPSMPGATQYRDDDSEVIRSGTSDVGSALVYSDDEDGVGARGRNADKAPIVTPTVDGTPTRQRSVLGDGSQSTGGQGLSADQNGDIYGKSGSHLESGHYEPADTPMSENPDYTLLDCHGTKAGKGSLTEGTNLVRHGQLFALASLVMLLVLTLTAIAIMESESALFEEVKSWPPLVVLRREYYYPAKSFFSNRLQHPLV